MATSNTQYRVGISCNLTETLSLLEKEYPTLRNWKVINTGLTVEQAQKQEAQYPKQNGCETLPYGIIKNGEVYVVYYFEF